MNINFGNIEKAFQEMKEVLNKGFLTKYLGKTEDETEYLLILSRNEVLTPLDLNNKNILFNDLALMFSIDYDGWDVENT